MESEIIAFDQPISIELACRSIKGWPKIYIEVTFILNQKAWSSDTYGRNSIIGYGSAFVPFLKGRHVINVHCWRPSSSLGYSFKESFLNITPQFVDKSAIYTSEEKFNVIGVSTGIVILILILIIG